MQIVGNSAADLALSFGVGGELTPRLTVTADGSLHWRNGSSTAEETTATLRTHRTDVSEWDPPELSPGEATILEVPLVGAHRGDIASVSLDSLDDELVQLSAVSREGAVRVVLRNAQVPTPGNTCDIDTSIYP